MSAGPATPAHRRCTACDRGWRHCEGVWIEHPDGGECSVTVGCDVPPEAHVESLACGDLVGSCCP